MIIKALNPMPLFDIDNSRFLQPHRHFTAVFLREVNEQLKKGAGPTEALQKAHSVALNETLKSTRQFPELFFEETELAEDEPGEGQEDEEIEVVQPQSQDEGQADPANEEDVLPQSTLGNLKNWISNLFEGYSKQKSHVEYSSSESEGEEGKASISNVRTPVAKKKKANSKINEDDRSSSTAGDLPGSISPLLIQREKKRKDFKIRRHHKIFRLFSLYQLIIGQFRPF